ncbi:hypothetical protein BU23DRAFT_584903 [Bimuria novae-zelandiae CBS 107.79]|uniref:Glycosyl transferase CAP10 domain-containing protein n=1 Tax=Bimuria novae-zelandiae CBS 107.79 TaxID=1447943 RepID=A0A6A5UNX0_9PLEO|nr:hypothetical protein BU23DRAFT_584903 [Bimuria novae-zelandiae CBS 107.79]
MSLIVRWQIRRIPRLALLRSLVFLAVFASTVIRHYPIDNLIANSTTIVDELLSKRTITLSETANAYRRRRHRHPPPDFNAWHALASAQDAVLVQSRKGKRKRLDQWIYMMQKIQHLLPDLNIPLNMLDKPRVTVPWEDVSSYVTTESELRKLGPAHETVQRFSSLDYENETLGCDKPTLSGNGIYWDQIRIGCAPGTPSRNVSSLSDFSKLSTSSKDPCLQPAVPSSHGSLIAPLSQSMNDSLIPMFSSSKLSMNNDILLPAFSYWQSRSDYTVGASHGPDWNKKTTKVLWRGVSSSGHNTPENWKRFHCHRFVTFMNASAFPSFPEPHRLYCHENIQGDGCPHTESHSDIYKEAPMAKQFQAKYLPDVDGNGFSGRYLAFLRSTSVPIKATLFSEWHDSRLLPWHHFVPMQNSFSDLYSILEYFIGVLGGEDDGTVVMRDGHDEQARKIAIQGKEWAEKVLRREDMLVCLLRLLLEYRRLCEEERDAMRWVDNLVDKI